MSGNAYDDPSGEALQKTASRRIDRSIGTLRSKRWSSKPRMLLVVPVMLAIVASVIVVAVVHRAHGAGSEAFRKPDAITSIGTDVWVADWGRNVGGGSVVEISGSNGTLTRVSTKDIGNPDAFLLVDNDLWIANSDTGGSDNVLGTSGSLVEISTASGAVLRIIRSKLDAPATRAAGVSEYNVVDPSAMVEDGQDLWVVNSGFSGDSVSEFRQSNGAFLRTVWSSALDFPQAITSTGSNLWVLDSFSGLNHVGGGALTEISASTGKVERVLRGPKYQFVNPMAVLSTGRDLWVVNESTVTEISARTRTLVRVIAGPRYGFDVPIGNLDPLSPNCITSNGAELWIVHQGDREVGASVTELSASTGALVRVIRGDQYGFDFPQAIEVSHQDVWVANWGNDSITEFSAATGALVRVVHLAHLSLTAIGH